MSESTCLAPIRIESVANLREHWSKRSQRAKTQRAMVELYLRQHGAPKAASVVTLTRIAPRPLDTDNLSGGFKACRDGVADWLGVDDSVKAGIEWRYAQRKGNPHQYAVEVKIE